MKMIPSATKSVSAQAISGALITMEISFRVVESASGAAGQRPLDPYSSQEKDHGDC
jgi:hypothetical protein